MAKFLSILLKIIVTIPVVAFLFFITIENRDQALSLTWSPFNEAAKFSVPVIVFAGLVLGFIWGSLILWSNTFAMRAERRALKKQIASLEAQVLLQKNEYDRNLKLLATPKPAIESTAQPVPRVALPEVL